jgi:NAD+ kinase
MNVGLVAHTGKPGAADLAAKVVAALAARGLPTAVEARTAALLGLPGGVPAERLGERSELVVVLGGDGTMLQVAHDMRDALRPLFGINLGTLGFLTCAGAEDHVRVVDAIAEGGFRLSERTMLEVAVEREGRVLATRWGLNEAVVARGDLSRLIRLSVRIDGAPLTEYNADGLIVATPTGSTAYSLAAGGPVIDPESRVFLVNPICPHVLTNRALVVPDAACIEAVPAAVGRVVELTVDGQEMLRVGDGDAVKIRRAPATLRLAMLPGVSFFEVLRQKLKWSGAAT